MEVSRLDGIFSMRSKGSSGQHRLTHSEQSFCRKKALYILLPLCLSYFNVISWCFRKAFFENKDSLIIIVCRGAKPNTLAAISMSHAATFSFDLMM